MKMERSELSTIINPKSNILTGNVNTTRGNHKKLL